MQKASGNEWSSNPASKGFEKWSYFQTQLYEGFEKWSDSRTQLYEGFEKWSHHRTQLQEGFETHGDCTNPALKGFENWRDHPQPHAVLSEGRSKRLRVMSDHRTQIQKASKSGAILQPSCKKASKHTATVPTQL